MAEDPLERIEREEREKKQRNGGLKTLMWVLVAVAALLAAALGYLLNQKSGLVKELEVEKADLTEQMLALQNDFATLSSDYENINSQLDTSREQVALLIEKLKKTEATNRAKIRQYEKELGTLRSIMKGYIVQIDSLNTLNKKLTADAAAARQEAADGQEDLTGDEVEDVERGAVAGENGHLDDTFVCVFCLPLFGHSREIGAAANPVDTGQRSSLFCKDVPQPPVVNLYVEVTIYIGPHRPMGHMRDLQAQDQCKSQQNHGKDLLQYNEYFTEEVFMSGAVLSFDHGNGRNLIRIRRSKGRGERDPELLCVSPKHRFPRRQGYNKNSINTRMVLKRFQSMDNDWLIINMDKLFRYVLMHTVTGTACNN